MKVGCFALIDPFRDMDHQLSRIANMGFQYADITDNNSGGSLGRDGGFVATVSLDENPFDIVRMFKKHSLMPTTVCAHARLLDPSSPGRYGNAEIMKAVKMASLMGIEYVITTEHEPSTQWASSLSTAEMTLITAEKLLEPLRLAEDLGITILLENHGPLTDSIEGMQALMEKLGHSSSLGVCLDTGNCWLGGADPVEFAKVFKDRIGHIHWKDLSSDWESIRGTGKMYGCGFSDIALGDGVIDIAGVFEVMRDSLVSHSTLEIIGEESVLQRSYQYLKKLGAE
jgi:inosose dehydratase